MVFGISISLYMVWMGYLFVMMYVEFKDGFVICFGMG